MASSSVTPFLFPHQPIRRNSKSAGERRHITEVRLQLFERSQGKCESQISPRCWQWLSWDTMHAAHIRSKARGGTFTLINLLAACPECHIGWEHQGGKPCPSK